MSKDVLYPLRRLHGRLVENRLERTRKKEMAEYLSGGKGKKVLIPGTPEHANLGDSAIVLAQMAFLQRCGYSGETIKEVSFSEYPKYRQTLRRYVDEGFLVAQLGGGNMGSQWKREEDLHRRILQDFPQNPTVIFPQTIYYAPEAQQEQAASVAVYDGRQGLTITARERESFAIVQRLYPNTAALLTPDIVLSATMETFGAKPQERSGVLFCMRSDAERAMTDEARQAVEQAAADMGAALRYTDMYSQVPVNRNNRATLVKEKMEEIAAAGLVITDRLHGMVFAAITGTPCIVFGNYNHKVSGTYEWIKYLPYVRYVETAEQARAILPEMLAMGGQVYDNAPLMPYFEELARVVRGYAEN